MYIAGYAPLVKELRGFLAYQIKKPEESTRFFMRPQDILSVLLLTRRDMTLTHSYQNPEKRNIFRLRDLADRPGHEHDLVADEPSGYADLNEREKVSVAEFMEFLANREDADDRDNFYMRDHGNRPVTREHEIGETAPVGYADLGEDDRFHVHEFIQFLVIRRRDGNPSGEN